MAVSNTQIDIVHSPGSSESSSPPRVHTMLVETDDVKQEAIQPPNPLPNPQEPQDPAPMVIDNGPLAMDGAPDRAPGAADVESSDWDELLSQMPLDAWFQVEDVVFSLEISRYVSQSLYMATLYKNSMDFHNAMQSGSTTPTVKPGVSQECPIMVEGVTKEQMDAFMGALRVQRAREWGKSPLKGHSYSKDNIAQFVRLAQKWELTLIEEQFYRLLGLPGQTPAFRLYAAVKFKDESLLTIRMLRSLVFLPLNKNPSDLKLLTPDVYRAVTFARDAIMVQRSAIAVHFPTIPNIEDVPHSHYVCVERCFMHWQVHIAKPLVERLDPAVEARDSFARALVNDDLVNQGCREHMRSDLVRHPDWETRWGKEDYVLRKMKEKFQRIIWQGGKQ
ncbi:hypothetical protein BJ165DRAFT_1399994 [Panaeolus papilionaceus]|nr:hypothetical protein BJ165DRAFT_1399994 [Panaeolus papilionaceus]